MRDLYARFVLFLIRPALDRREAAVPKSDNAELLGLIRETRDGQKRLLDEHSNLNHSIATSVYMPGP